MTSFNSENNNEIIIPESVTSIGNGAFSGFNTITNIIAPSTYSNGIPAIFGTETYANSYLANGYYVPTSLKTVTITTTKTIGNNAFRGCSSITNITIPLDVESIGNYAFYGCSSLVSLNSSSNVIVIPDTVLNISQYAFATCGSITTVKCSKDLATIGAYAFYNCAKLSSLNSDSAIIALPEGVAEINENTFRSCSAIVEVTCSENLVTIGMLAFGDCSALKRWNSTEDYMIVIPSKVTTIGNSAFGGDNLITKLVNTSETVTTYASAFSGLSSLKEITLPSLNSNPFGQWFGTTVFPDSYKVNGDTYSIPISLVRVNITKDTIIPGSAFYGASHLERVDMPNNVTNIAGTSFKGCASLVGINSDTKLVLPEGLEIIGVNAFYNCSKITDVELAGDSLLEIGQTSFYNCTLLRRWNSNTDNSIIIPDSVNTIGDSAFNTVSITELTLGKGISSLATGSVKLLTGVTKLNVSTEGAKFATGSLYLNNYMANNGLNLTEVNITSGKYIPSYFCYKLTNLEKVTIADEIETIGSYAFYQVSASKLNSNTTGEFILPKNVTNIETYAFYKNNNMQRLDLGEKLETIGTYAFSACTNVVKVICPDTIKTISNYAFADDSSITQFNSDYLNSLIIPSNCVTIGSYAFRGLTGISIATVNDTISTIGRGAFKNMTFLSVVQIPFLGKSLKPTGNAAYELPLGYIFDYTTTNTSTGSLSGYIYSGIIVSSSKYWYSVPTSLTKVVVTVQNIMPNYGFYNCDDLDLIYLPVETDTETGIEVFYNCPATVYKTYKSVVSAPWNGVKVATSFHGGDGTEGNPYQIFDGAELVYLMNLIKGGNTFDGKYFVLISNIDLDSKSITVDSDKEFKGTIDGKGFKIKTLTLTGTSTHTALFPKLSGTIKNISFEGGIISATVTGTANNNYGGIVGELLSTGKVQDVFSSVNVQIAGNTSNAPTSYPNHIYAGGIVGYNNGGTILNCFCTGNVSSTYSAVDSVAGGIVGYTKGGTITGCYSGGNITANGQTLTKCKNGQIVGDSEGEITLANCYKLSTATLIRYGSTGSVSNTLGTADTQANCIEALKVIYNEDIWYFSGSAIPTLKLQ